MKKCVILMTNKTFLNKSLKTIEDLITKGVYKEDIVLLVGDDLKNEKINFNYEKLIIKYFPDFNRENILKILKEKPIGDGRVLNKIFQWHKLHCFDFYFKQWDVCFYIDAGMHIFDDINCFFNLPWENSLIAHSDAYPIFVWKLNIQFDDEKFPELYQELYKNYNMDIDYFQSGVMIYDTKLIKENTKNDLINLSEKYINSKTNEQGILNLYFNSDKKLWKSLPTTKNNNKFYYDYWERDDNKYSDYRMLKYPQTL